MPKRSLHQNILWDRLVEPKAGLVYYSTSPTYEHVNNMADKIPADTGSITVGKFELKYQIEGTGVPDLTPK